MKTKLITLFLVVGTSLQVAAMGHPHNLFAARKNIKAKRVAVSQPRCTGSPFSKMTTYAKNTVTTSATVLALFADNCTK